MTDKINTAVSPEVHPGVVSSLLNDHVTDNDEIVSITGTALGSIFKTLSDIAEARQTLDKQVSVGILPRNEAHAGKPIDRRTPHAQLHDKGQAALDAVSARADAAYAKLQKLETHLEVQITESLRDLHFGAIVQQETRTMLRSEPDKMRRFTMAMEAARSGESGLPMVAAIMGAPAYLSGITDEQRTLVRETAAKFASPALTARRDAARRAMEILRRAGGHVISERTTLKRYVSTGAAQMAEAIGRIGAEQ